MNRHNTMTCCDYVVEIFEQTRFLEENKHEEARRKEQKEELPFEEAIWRLLSEERGIRQQASASIISIVASQLCVAVKDRFQ